MNASDLRIENILLKYRISRISQNSKRGSADSGQLSVSRAFAGIVARAVPVNAGHDNGSKSVGTQNAFRSRALAAAPE
jgi:hypothetical protein